MTWLGPQGLSRGMKEASMLLGAGGAVGGLACFPVFEVASDQNVDNISSCEPVP